MTKGKVGYELDYFGRFEIPPEVTEDYEEFRDYLYHNILVGDTSYNAYTEARARALWEGAQIAQDWAPHLTQLGIYRETETTPLGKTLTELRGTWLYEPLGLDKVREMVSFRQMLEKVGISYEKAGLPGVAQWSYRNVATGRFVGWELVRIMLGFI